ncbi:MAG: hypothetical protein HOP36_02275 [Methyloglobulus sp.]|nr:hypothetical protein [Methyloglobulus sp.]
MPEGDRIKLTPLPAQLEGEHDMLLDYERSLAPYERLEINAKLLDSSSAIFAVAEVDDPNGKHMWLVLEISRSREKLGKPKMRVAVNFRMPTPRKGEDKLWPLIHIEHKPDDKTPILLDGSKVLKGTDYRFRRWSHVRFAGSLEVSEVSLSAPNRINMQNMN